MKVLLLAGEESGLLYARQIAAALRAADPAVEIRGYADYGFETSDLAVIGFSAVLFKIFYFMRVRRTMMRAIDDWKPDAVCTVDYPGMNLRLAAYAKTRGVRSVHVVCPQVWAWKQGRIPKIQASLDALACFFPFEPALFRPGFATFVGHPLAEAFRTLRRAEPSGEGRLVALLPGSRRGEIAKILPGLLDVAAILRSRFGKGVRFAIPAASERVLEQIRGACAAHGGADGIEVRLGGARELLLSADVAAVASGTATLEAALAGCPTALVYRVGRLFAFIMRFLLTGTKFLGLANIVWTRCGGTGEPPMPEYLQEDFVPSAVAERLALWLADPAAHRAAVARLADATKPLGSDGAAVGRIAEIVRRGLGAVVLCAFACGLASPSRAGDLGPFFHETTCTNYSARLFDGLCEKSVKAAALFGSFGGCTSCVNGRHFGRNYDWVLGTADEWLVRVPARRKRHASIGMASLGMLTVAEKFGIPISEPMRRACLPYLTMDGVNDAGVAVSCHYVEEADVGATVGTRPGAPRLPCPRFVRRVLDACASAADATNLAFSVSLFATPGGEIQWLVADRTGASFAIGVVSNRVRVIPQTRVLVNYSPFPAGLRPYSSGMEREARARAGLAAAGSAEGMAGLLRTLYYSNYVRSGNECAWWSEMNGTANPFRARWPESPATFYHGDTNDYREAAAARMAVFAKERAELEADFERVRRTQVRPPCSEAWATIHSCVYDLEARAVDVRMLEGDLFRRFALVEE